MALGRRVDRYGELFPVDLTFLILGWALLERGYACIVDLAGGDRKEAVDFMVVMVMVCVWWALLFFHVRAQGVRFSKNV